jgi:translocation and assembly module TamB
VARRALARRVALRSAIGTAALVVVLLLLGYWLLTTIGGRDLLLSQIVSRLPAGTTLQWQRAEGPAAGPLTLHGVRFTHQPADAPRGAPIVFTAQSIVLDPAIRPLLGRRLRLDALDIARATLELPESDEPFELPRWPESLPQIAPPLSLQADTIRIDGLKVTRDAQPLVDIRAARGGVDAAQGFLHVEQLAIDSDRGRFTLHGDYVPREDYRVDLTGTAVLPVPAGRTPLRLGLVARGDLSRLDVAVSGNAPAPLRASVTLRGKDDPRWSARAKSDALDLALLMGEADNGTPLAFALQADGVADARACRAASRRAISKPSSAHRTSPSRTRC